MKNIEERRRRSEELGRAINARNGTNNSGNGAKNEDDLTPKDIRRWRKIAEQLFRKITSG